MNDICYQCHIKTIDKLIAKFNPSPELTDLFKRSVNELLDKNKDESNPYLVTYLHRLAKNIINNTDLYAKEKKDANKLLLGSYSRWKTLANSSVNPFYAAAKLAVAGNIIDYGAHSVPNDIESHLLKLFNTELAINETALLKKELSKARSVLYLGDNAGEIVFDKLFIETINHADITYVVRGKPIINDVTIEDAKHVNIDKVCTVITNGYDAPSTLLEYCSIELREAFELADVVISKGQGNFEGLLNTKHRNLFFMLMAKCEPMAELLGVKKGDMVVKKWTN